MQIKFREVAPMSRKGKKLGVGSAAAQPPQNKVE